MGESESFFWVEEGNGTSLGTNKRKYRSRSKKMEFVGWASKPLSEFLEFVGVDATAKHMSQSDVTTVVERYATDHNLYLSKRKRIVCDERLLSLFGKKTILRNNISRLLDPHFADNLIESDDDDDDVGLYSSNEEEDKNVSLSYERKRCKKKVLEAPKSCFAAIVPDNIKRVYLKRSLVQDLLKDFETFEGKIVGSFVRIKSDPNDYLQPNPHMLVQVTGLKKASGTHGNSAEILLQVSNLVKDVRISMLSEDNFSKEECQDLLQRVRNGLLKRPTVVDLQEKVQLLHADITKHWLARELSLLQKLIDRANEKGWRKEFTLFEYLERRQLLQTPDEQSRLLREVPEVIADEIESQAIPQVCPDNMKQENVSPQSTPVGIPAFPTCNMTAKGTSASFSTDFEGAMRGTHLLEDCEQVTVREYPKQPTEVHDCLQAVVNEQQRNPTEIHGKTNVETKSMNVEDSNCVRGVTDVRVIDLSDSDDENEDQCARIKILDSDVGSCKWHYEDPQGDIQGPFYITSLKHWKEADFFPTDFKVWQTGQSQNEAVLLTDILQQIFPG